MPLNEVVVDGVISENFKVGGGGAAFYLNLAMKGAVAHQDRVLVFAEQGMSRFIKDLNEIDPSEAASISKTLTGNDLGATALQLAAAIAGGRVISETPKP